jgi:hypothetical protein
MSGSNKQHKPIAASLFGQPVCLTNTVQLLLRGGGNLLAQLRH